MKIFTITFHIYTYARFTLLEIGFVFSNQAQFFVVFYSFSPVFSLFYIFSFNSTQDFNWTRHRMGAGYTVFFIQFVNHYTNLNVKGRANSGKISMIRRSLFVLRRE